ncbi:hypothetical protein SNE40_009670 [Patella caerulea]|uniref:Reverse transcriptase domain-containing protein n=1 Tax=Patella caerulea TaxID=87958 RepID=A0AAN8JP43_PATCE
MYLNQFVELLEKCECKGIYIDERTPNLMQLLFADAMANISDTVGQLQKQIDVLNTFCKDYGMKVNTSKTKVLVFKRGGKLKSYESWSYQGEKLEVVNEYKYRGLCFTSSLSWYKSINSLCLSANKALFIVWKFIHKYNLDQAKSLYLFDHMVVPILTYGAEIWGYQLYKTIETVQNKFCKKL